MTTTQRVALVVVHGIADQRPGQTVREVARLLCDGLHRTSSYVQGETHEVLVPVDRLEPRNGPASAAPEEMQQAATAAEPRKTPGAPSGFYQATQQTATPAEAERAAADREAPPRPSDTAAASRAATCPESPDLGLELNDYLLGRLVLPEGDALYESERISLVSRPANSLHKSRSAAPGWQGARSAHIGNMQATSNAARRDAPPGNCVTNLRDETLDHRARDQALDLYEMYWADLSRLGAGGVRALSSLYQLFFHLNTLAADLVDQVSLTMGGGSGWRSLQRLHAWLAWLMKGPAALFQLAMLLLVLFGTASLVAPELHGQLLSAAFGIGAIVLASLAVLVWVRPRSGPARWVPLLLFLSAAVGSLAMAVLVLQAEWIPRIYFGSCALLVWLVGAYLIERYSGIAQGVRWLGHVVVLATVVSLGLAGRALLPSVTTQSEWMLTAALYMFEWLLAGLLLSWGAFVALQIVALSLGLWLGRGGDRAVTASLHTSRLALISSTGSFAVLSLVLWSVVSFVAGHALDDLLYEPVVFGSGYRSGAIFLEGLVQSFGAFFTPLVLAFVVIMAAALLVLLPSLIQEISPTANIDADGVEEGANERAQRLGSWLGGGIRFLGTALLWLLPVGAIVGSLFYVAFVMVQLPLPEEVGGNVALSLVGLLEIFQGETLVAVGKWLAGGALTVAALGSRFTETFGRLRVAIDAVLDVDNYFADPPNRQPPRARIFSRYVALLRFLRDAGYSRIVIVAHSQGTVITADLLRYLHVRGRLRRVVGGLPVALLTVGSPIRDLYAERFPLLYRWMGRRAAGFAEARPAAADLGLTEWVNACRSGDYVGRFIWTPPAEARFAVAVVGPDGRVDALRAGDRTEFCLGAGAHTRYFSSDATALAVELERLIAGAAVHTVS